MAETYRYRNTIVVIDEGKVVAKTIYQRGINAAKLANRTTKHRTIDKLPPHAKDYEYHSIAFVKRILADRKASETSEGST